MDSTIIYLYMWGSLQHQKYFSSGGFLEPPLPPCQVGLTYGWKSKKQPSGPIELDLEAGNLVLGYFSKILVLPMFLALILVELN